jgi:hypothetical protein
VDLWGGSLPLLGGAPKIWQKNLGYGSNFFCLLGFLQCCGGFWGSFVLFSWFGEHRSYRYMQSQWNQTLWQCSVSDAPLADEQCAAFGVDFWLMVVGLFVVYAVVVYWLLTVCTARMFWRKHSILNRYTVLGKLGAGAFGEVFEAWDTVRLRKVAIKKYIPRGDFQELQNLSKCQGECVVELLESYMDEKYVYLIMSQCDPIPEKLSYSQLAKIAHRCILGLSRIAAQRLAHMDIKPDNILIQPGSGAVIADFGLACKIESKGMVYQLAGTHGYLSPEAFKADKTGVAFYGEISDVYSLGITLQELCSRCSEPIPFSFKHLLSLMIIADARQRPSAKSLILHNKMCKELMNKEKLHCAV